MYKLLLIFFFFTTMPDDLQTGINYFNARSENAKGLQANSINVDKAILVFESLVKQNKHLQVAGGYCLQCYNFKGRFVFINDNDKKKTYAKTIELGNDLVKKFPKDGKIRFELTSAIALSAEINGIMKSIDDEVMTKLIFHTKMLIETDSMYNNGGGWKFDAGLNYKTPYIPLIMTWPDKDKAVAIMKKALKYFPTDVGANFYYAEALYENNQKKLAKIYFEATVKFPSRKDFMIEDEFFKVKAKKYLAKL
ncbi:MAG TPA: tetratricopeptide repeat protein [Bacteroidia bacterium]|nr:tetratricopeptide repeat protein [Bacteroidia bacterium]